MDEKRTSRLFAPGPVYVPDRIRRAMAQPTIHHRTAEFKKLLAGLHGRLRRLFHAESWDPLVLCCSGTGVMEGAVVNFMRRDAKALVVSAGKFGERWSAIMRAYGCEPIELKLDWGRSVSVDQMVALLKQHPDTRAVYLTSADTSTGIEHPVDELGPAIRAHSDALIVVDAVCDFGGGRDFYPTKWDFDVVVSCSQKCLMLPAGVCVAAVSPRAWSFSETCDLPRFYFDWRAERTKQLEENITAWTTPVSLFQALEVSLSMLEDEGIENVAKRYARTASIVRAGVAAMGLELFPDRPSNALTVIKAPDGIDGTKVVAHLEKAYGVRITNGQDRIKGKVFRVGHMGFVTETDALGLVHLIERTLADLGYRHGEPGAALAAAQARAYAKE